MRELKFKVFTENVGMSRAFRFWELTETNLAQICANKHKIATGRIPDRCPAVIQFTGQKIKGKDIYDGDILESDARWYEVTWCDHHGGWMASGLFGHEDIMLSELCGDRDTCLNGNIYENPELLDAK